MFAITYVNHNDDPKRRTQLQFSSEEQYDAEVARINSLPPAQAGTAHTLIGYITGEGEYIER